MKKCFFVFFDLKKYKEIRLIFKKEERFLSVLLGVRGISVYYL